MTSLTFSRPHRSAYVSANYLHWSSVAPFAKHNEYKIYRKSNALMMHRKFSFCLWNIKSGALWKKRWSDRSDLLGYTWCAIWKSKYTHGYASPYLLICWFNWSYGGWFDGTWQKRYFSSLSRRNVLLESQLVRPKRRRRRWSDVSCLQSDRRVVPSSEMYKAPSVFHVLLICREIKIPGRYLFSFLIWGFEEKGGVGCMDESNYCELLERSTEYIRLWNGPRIHLSVLYNSAVVIC